MKTFNISIDEQRQELIKASKGVLQLNIAAGNPLLGFDDNRWDGYDYVIEHRRGDIYTGVRIVNIDGAIQILSFSEYLIAATFTITGKATDETIITIVAHQLQQLATGAKA